MGVLRPLCLLPLLVAMLGCQALPKDPFDRAERATRQGSFLNSLQALDAVPPDHPRYAEARSYAQALERRIRTSHELILQGLGQRAEWRDSEALRSFEQAKAVWPQVRGVAGLIQATRNRMRVLGPGARPKVGSGVRSAEKPVEEIPSVTTVPVGVDQPPARPEAEPQPAPSQVTAKPSPAPPVQEGSRPRAEAPRGKPPVQGAKVTDPGAVARRQAGLHAVQRHLERGEMDQAMDRLEDLRAGFPKDQRVAAMLARVLHQRALLFYGQGRLEAAIDDWDWVVRLKPSDRQAKAFLRAAKTEFVNRQRR